MKRTVLLASARMDVLETLPITLKLAGLKVVVVESGLDAIRKARSGWPELIILDLTLPDMDGSTAADILRRLPSTATIPTVLLRGAETSFSGAELLHQIGQALSLCQQSTSNDQSEFVPEFTNTL